MASRQEIIDALRRSLPDLDADALEETSAQRVTGVIVSDRFLELDHDERHQLIWSTLDRELGKTRLRNVGPIVAMTFPEMFARHLDED